MKNIGYVLLGLLVIIGFIDHLGLDKIQKINDDIRNEGYSCGYNDGHTDGYNEGYDVGYEAGREIMYDAIADNPFFFLDMHDIIDEYLSDHEYIIEEYIEKNY